MMLSNIQRIYVQHPARRDNLIPAAVLEVKERRIGVRFLQPAAIPPKSRTRLFFHDQHQVFNSIECEFIRMNYGGENPIGTIGLIGNPRRDDHREAFRVGAHGDSMPVHIDGVGHGQLLNISCTGIAVSIDDDGLTADTWVDTTLEYDLQQVPGRMQVRNWCKLPDGRFRYGLMANPEDGQLLSELSRISQDLQTLKARRASRLAVKPRCTVTDPATHTGVADTNTDANRPDHLQDTRDLQFPGGETKRQHERKPWTGVAKIYLREEQNLRVLDVTTIDLSPGGLSFACSNYIYEGSELLFEKPIPSGLFRIRGIVRSIHINAPGKHRAGIQFVGAPLKPGEYAPEFETMLQAG